MQSDHCSFSTIPHGRKKSSNDRFDVTMVSYDGVETCKLVELVAIYCPSSQKKKYSNNIGLYRDDGLSAFDKSPQEIEKIKKDCCKILKHHDLKITVEAIATKVNFLDVTLDLKKR